MANKMDERIVELIEMAQTPENYNTVWNKVELLSNGIRNRKFNANEIKSFDYKIENLIDLATEILKEETIKSMAPKHRDAKKYGDGVVEAKYDGTCAESRRSF